jgi:hypothetical protein
MPKRRRGIRPFVDQLDERCLLSGSSGLTPAQITSAYGLNAITFTTSSGTVKGDGTGETIALIEMYHDPNLQSDLQTFDTAYGLPTPTLNVIDQAGSQTDSGWGEEESLDVEWAHAIAPGANLLVVEASPGYTDNQALQNLMTAVSTASSTPGVTVVSMSWGFNEFPGETQYDSYFTTPGITYIAAAGDSPGVTYPAASPDVLSVGATTLNLNGSGGYGSETAWSDSGGGYSQFEAEPAYQDSVQSTGERSTPDVAFDGDPNTGATVYFTPATGGGNWNWSTPQGSWQTVGGTSLGTPAWAGIIAIVDQGRLLSGKSSLSGATETLPSLYDLPSSDFLSIAASPSSTPGGGGGTFPWGGFGGWGALGGGGNDLTGGSSTGATANTSTGLGTPNGSALIDDLTASTTITSLPSPTPTSIWPIPSPTPMPTPSPQPTPTPTSTGGKHHHHHVRPVHGSGKTATHATANRTHRLVKQAKQVAEDRLAQHHRI